MNRRVYAHQEKFDRGAFPYQADLRLSPAPFGSCTRETAYFTDPEIIDRIGLLQHLIQFSDLLLIVTGPEGSGKTALLHELARQAGENWHVCKLDAGNIFDQDSLLACIADGFKLDSKTMGGALRQRLVHCWMAMQLVGKYPVLLIDNADCLEAQMRRTLLLLDRTMGATLRRVRIILFSKTDIGQNILGAISDDLKHGVRIYTTTLAPFSEQQTDKYLTFRMAAAGYSGDRPFYSHEIAAIHKVSKGLPSRINELAHQTLAKSEREGLSPDGKNVTGPKWPARHSMWWWVVLVLIVMFVAISIRGDVSSILRIQPEPQGYPQTLPYMPDIGGTIT